MDGPFTLTNKSGKNETPIPIIYLFSIFGVCSFLFMDFLYRAYVFRGCHFETPIPIYIVISILVVSLFIYIAFYISF